MTMQRGKARTLKNLDQTIYQENLAEKNKDGGDYIRLIRVVPGKYRLSCVFNVVSLQEAPPYAAVSYSWGAGVPGSAHLYVVSGSEESALLISQDLHQAICRLEAHSEQEWLWIDAICINQFGTGEKSDQVARMRDIYFHAECVFVWLGEELYDENNKNDPESVRLDKPYCGLTYTKIRQLMDLGDSVWWSRVWIIQEISVARNVVVCIGSLSCRWDDFVGAMRIKLDSFSSLPVLTENASEDLDAERQRLYDGFQGMRLQITHLSHMRKSISMLGSSPLRPLLRSSGNSRSSEAVDKIYALLGIATAEVRQKIGVSYGTKPSQVFALACMAIIKTEDCLDILVDQWPRFYGQPLYSSKATSPSFVPDFSGHIRTSPYPLSWTSDICASGTSKPNAKYGWNDLKVQGLKFDRITKVCQGLCEDTDELTSATQHLTIVHERILPIVYGILQQDTVSQGVDASCLKGLKRAHRIWQTLTSDSDPYQVTAEDAELKQEVIDILWRSRQAEFETLISALGPLVPKAETLASQMCRTLKARVLFSTSMGFFGIAAPEVQAEDVIVVPFGASAPFVLRRVPDQLPGIESYALVVDCNVNGIMEGELMELYEKGQIEDEVFELD